MARPRRGLQESSGLFGAIAAPDAGRVPVGNEGHRERLRARLFQAGPGALSDHEMLEALLFLGIPRKDTKPIAKALIARFGSFAAVLTAPPAELTEVEGVGEGAAAAIRIVHAAALRMARTAIQEKPLISNWDALIAYLDTVFKSARIEQVRVLYFDTRNHLLADEAQGHGTVNHTPVYPREVIGRAIELKATALILVHNHPSGDPTPSRADIEMTREIKAAADIFGIRVHDHIIVGNGRITSFAREGLLAD